MVRMEERAVEMRQAVFSKDYPLLVEVILRGDSNMLEDIKTKDAEMNEFLSNVPAFRKRIQALHLAAKRGDVETLSRLLDRAKFALCRESATGASLLHTAVAAERHDMALHLVLICPALLAAQDSHGRSALHLAASLRLTDLYSALVERGADPNLPDCNGHTPQLLWQKASPSPISAPTSPSSPSSERIPRTPTTPQYAALDWSHHSGEGECRGAPSVQHTTLRPDSPEVAQTLCSTKEEDGWKKLLGHSATATLERALSRAFKHLLKERPADPVDRLASLLEQQSG